MLKNTSLFLFVIGLTACDGLNSELDTTYIEDPGAIQKPRCHFKVADNCFTRSLDLITSCAETAGKMMGQFTNDMRFCTHDKGDFVEFVKPLQLLELEGHQDIEFRVYTKNTTCYHFKKSQSSIVVDQTPYGKVSVQTLANGDLKVSCLFEESFTIPALAIEKGCQNHKVASGEFVPQTQLVTMAGEENVLALYLQGQGASPSLLFSCSKN